MRKCNFRPLALIATLALCTACRQEEVPQPAADSGPFIPAQITLTESGELKELANERLIFIDNDGTEWAAPRGTLTDGASIPRMALPLSDGRWDSKFLKAAVVHDAYCQQENEFRTPEQYRTKPWQEVHLMFYEACLAGGTGPLLAKTMFVAVWLFGPKWGDDKLELPQAPPEALTRGFTGAKEWIENTDPSIEEIQADLERRQPLLTNLYGLESGALRAMETGDQGQAVRLLEMEADLLREALAQDPDDPMLLDFRGYWHKNRAVMYQELKRDRMAAYELQQSEETFSAVIENQPNDPAALNGLGSVAILRGDLDQGESYVRRALEIAPEYEAAEHDLRQIAKIRNYRDEGRDVYRYIARVDPDQSPRFPVPEEDAESDIQTSILDRSRLEVLDASALERFEESAAAPRDNSN